MRTLAEPLVSNGYTLDMSSSRLGWLEPTDAGTPVSEVRDIYRKQGYVYLKNFFDRDFVLDFRQYFVAATSTASWSANELVRSPEYDAFCNTPRLWAFYEEFLEGKPYLHKRKQIRLTFPNLGRSTGAHYDLTYLRAGTDKLCSSWIPLGDTPVELGGLIYLENSDALGRKLEAEFAAKNSHLSPAERISAYNRDRRVAGWVTDDLPAAAEQFQSRWLIADYEAGDMVIHSPYMIHASTENCDKSWGMRLSTDIRFQLAEDPIDQRWANHWRDDDQL